VDNGCRRGELIDAMRVGLSWGRWTPEDLGRDDAVETAHGRTQKHNDEPRFSDLVRR
jgi:hypothetical protein